MKKGYLGCDVGTTGTKTMLFTDNGVAVGRGYKDYPLFTPFEGAYEQDANDWYNSLKESIKQACSASEFNVQALSLSAQGGSFFLADIVDGKIVPLCNALTWMDARATCEFDELKTKISVDEVYNIVGWRLSRGSAIARLNWLKKHNEEVFNRAKIILSTADYIYYRLTGKLVIDYSSAAMMGMFDYKELKWNEKLVDLAGVSVHMLPKLVPTCTDLGEILPEVASDLGLNQGVKVYAGAHDQYAASIGANYFSRKDLLVATGTTWVIFGNSEKTDFGANYFAPGVHPMGDYGVITSAVSSGSVINWEKEVFNVSYDEINENVPKTQPDENLLVYPFIAGCRRGNYKFSVENAELRHTAFDVIRATMEGVAFEIENIVSAYNDCEIGSEKIILSGGATRSKIWMKILATVLNRDLYISNQADRCCFGAYSIARKKDLGNYFVFPFEGEIVSPDKELLSFYQKKSKLYNKAFE